MNKNFKMYLSIIVIMAIVLMSIFANWISPHNPNKISISEKLQGHSREHILGTDSLGRDMLSRIIHGGRASIMLALQAVILSMLIGLVLGVIAGYYGGIFDSVITALSNIFQGIPDICFMLAVAGAMGGGVKSLLIGLLITSWPSFSRIVRAEVLRIKSEEYIMAMIQLGCNDFDLIIKHIIPNMMSSIVIIFTTRLGRSILTVAALSYLGLGIKPPTADWSVMINDARMFYRSASWLIIYPGLIVFILLYAINTLGNCLRDKADVRSGEISYDK